MRTTLVALALVLTVAWAPARECSNDMQCVERSKPLTAGLCSGFSRTCDNESAPWTPRVRGNLTSFCNAYVAGCSGASLELSHGQTSIEVRIKGPGAFEPDACELEVVVESTRVTCGSADRIGDSVQACIHNVPVYFFKSVEAAGEGSAYCCGYPF